MPISLTILFIIFFVIFMTWQFKVIMKYNKCDIIKVDEKTQNIKINSLTIPLRSVKSLTIREGDVQPSIFEKIFTRYAIYHSMYDLEFLFNDGTTISATLNSKPLAQKLIKQLSQHCEIIDHTYI